MDRHDPHRVVIGLGEHGLVHPHAVGGLPVGPRHVLPERRRRRPHARLGPGRAGSAPGATRPVSARPVPASSRTRRSRTRRSSRSAGAVQCRSAARARRYVMASWTASSASGSGSWPPTRFQRPPRSRRHRYRSTSLHPNSAERSVLTSASSSVGVVDGPEREQQVPHLPAGVGQRAALGAVGDVGVVERVLEGIEHGAARDEDGDVAGPGWARQALVVAAPPSAARASRIEATTSRTSRARSSSAQGLVGVLGCRAASTGGPASVGRRTGAAAGRPAARRRPPG